MTLTVVTGIDGLHPALGRLFVVVGVFDGLHLGHGYLLDALAREAHRTSARPAVVTFDHHPDEILTGQAPPLLCDPAERLARLEAAGIAVAVVQHFDVELRETSYEAFVRRIAARVDLAGFVMTSESAFGYERRGTPRTVAALGREMGYEVVVVPPFEVDGLPVRSTDIRAAIAAGDLRRAERLLGRPYRVAGRGVIAGPDRVAIRFAVPVALPPDGTYEVTVGTGAGGRPRPAVATVDRGVLVLAGMALEGPAQVDFSASG